MNGKNHKTNNMKQFILDYSKWRCGRDSATNKLGEGYTRLLNQEGYMCCLGQYCEQEGVDVALLKNKYAPQSLGIKIPLLTKDGFWETELSIKAMRINDNQFTTPDEKIEKLRELFAAQGVELKVINKP
jgi:hypothetical protein